MSSPDPKKSKFRLSIAFQAVLLGSFTLAASVLLGTSDIETRDAIKLRAEEDLKASIGQVVADNLYDNDLIASTLSLPGPAGEPVTVYQGTRDGVVTALAYTMSSAGYGGTIVIIMAVNPDGKILGVRTLSHAETPGLGDKIEVEKDDWILDFSGLSLGSPPPGRWAVKKDGGDFDQFSGATITPRAVVRAVKRGLDFFDLQKKKLLIPVKIEQERVAS